MIRWFIAAALAATLVGCSASHERAAMSMPSAGYEGHEDSASRARQAPGESSLSAQAEFQPASFPRQVIRRAELSVRVEDVEASEKRVKEMVRQWQGFVENSKSRDLEGEHPSVDMTIRVPERIFDTAIEELAALGWKRHGDITGEDVTMQLVDMEARLKTLRAQEEAYREILRKATKISDVIEVQQHLTNVRSQIESLDAQRKALSDLAALSTIRLLLDQSVDAAGPVADPNWFSEGWASTTQGFAGVMRGLTLTAMWLLVYAPIWLPISLVVVFAIRRAFRMPRPATATGVDTPE